MADLNQNELREIDKLKQNATEILEQVKVMFCTSFEGLMKNDIKILDKVLKDEDKVMEAYNNLTAFAIEVSKKDLSDNTKRKVLDWVAIASIIEEMGDYCVGLVEQIEYKVSEKLLFSEAAVEEYKDLHKTVEQTLVDTIKILEDGDKKLAESILKSESVLDTLVDKYKANHIDRAVRGICDEWARVRYLEMLDIIKRIAHRSIEIVSKLTKSS
jgi:phosphate:Na+ symporter